jgi:Ca2+-binding RTX toxin-like protein
MLTQTIPRLNADGSTNDIGLLEGFLNPNEYHNGGAAGSLSSTDAATAIIMGLSDQAGNEIDEFVTNTLRNNLVGLPLDLPAINMARARSEGIPPLNDVRRQIFAETNDGAMQPYANWIEWGLNLKHPESLVNFVAAYGRHPSISAAPNSLASRRAAATLLVDPPLGTDPASIPADAADFMGGTGLWATPTSGPNAGVTITGVDDIDLWMGQLAERTNLFGGHLGSTANYVFEKQLTDLQNGDRLYYLARTPGMNLRTQLEGNSFAELVMRNTNAHTLKADAFATADCKFELGRLTFSGTIVNDDPLSECDERSVLIHMPDGTIRYREINAVDPPGINGQSVYNGTAGPDKIYGGNDNDTFLGNEGNDTIEGNGGADIALGGEGDDVITDFAGDDVPKGGPGNDAIDAGPGLDIIMAGEGKDFTNGGANINETFAGSGNDFVMAGQSLDAVFGDTGDDWIEGGDQPDLLQGDSGNLFFKDTGNPPGNDVQIGQGGDDDYDHEGGDDIGLAGPGIEKIAGGAGYDWQIGLGENQAQNQDLNLSLVGLDALVIDVRDKYNETEALSGWKFNDKLRGDDVVPGAIGGGGFVGCDALDPAGVARISGLNALITTFPTPLQPILDSTSVGICPLVGQGATVGNAGNVWAEGNLLLGGSGSDLLEGRGANDILDGDRYVNVRISVRANADGTGAEIGSTDLMEHSYQLGNPMTLQQAVFARIVNPGQLIIVRELLNDAAPTDVDTAEFTGSQAEYLVTDNGNGSITVDHQGGIDGVDTLWNVELLRFCDARDVNGVCTAPVTVPASGTVSAAPALSVTPTGTPTPVAFGTITVNTGPVTRAITVSNTGGGTLNVTGATIGGPQANQFAILNNGCTTVGAGGSCTIDVGFSPTVAAPAIKNATLTVNTNAGNTIVPLRGTAIAVAVLAQIAIDGPTDFGTRRIGEPRTQVVGVTNTGAANLNVTGVVFTGPFTGDRGTCNVPIAAGAQCRINVTFNPAAPLGAKSGTVRLTVAGIVGNPNATATLTGTSKAAAVAVAALRIAQPPAPTALRPVNVSLRVSVAATIKVQVRRANGQLVWSKVMKAKAGANSIRWNLRDSKGRKVKKGSYRFTITVTDASGATVVMKKTVRVR